MKNNVIIKISELLTKAKQVNVLESAELKEGIAFIRLMINRCYISVVLIKMLLTLDEIAVLYDYNDSKPITQEVKDKILEVVKKRHAHVEEYLKVYSDMLPDRGCEGNVISYCLTMPTYIDAVASNFVDSIEVVQGEEFDAPPPDTEAE